MANTARIGCNTLIIMCLCEYLTIYYFDKWRDVCQSSISVVQRRHSHVALAMYAGRGQELRRAAARVQCAEHESRKSGEPESGTAKGTGTVAGGNRVAK